MVNDPNQTDSRYHVAAVGAGFRLRAPVYDRLGQAGAAGAGGTRDPAELYTAFRGRLPSAEGLLKRRGLLEGIS